MTETIAAAVMVDVTAAVVAAAVLGAIVKPAEFAEASAATADATKMERTSKAGMMIHIKKRPTM